MWDFDKLTDEQKAQIREAYEAGAYKVLLALLNKLKVSPDTLTPCCSFPLITQWMRWAIHEGKV